MTTTAAPLPRADRRDRRTIAQRTPQAPVTVWVHAEGIERKLHVAVGTGGWAQDAENAAACALNLPAEALTVVSVQGGHV
jgi:hypothetical protein